MNGTKKRVFFSFAYDDVDQVRGLRLLAANPNYELEFYDESVRVAIDSTDADYVKRRIREKIARSSVTVCLIGTTTYASRWVDWELREAVARDHTIIAMALKGIEQATLPTVVKELNLPFWSWDPQYLNTLIAES